MKIHFFGGAGTVTGSKTLIETASISILVDCGLFQGLKELRELNRMPLSYDPKKIDYVLLTHGHLDHCGWLPKLVKDGFNGKIFCTSPTKEITKLILLDSAKIQEEDKIFGSISLQNVLDKINESGHEVQKKQINLPSGSIKTLGKFTAHISLHPEVSVAVPIEVKEEVSVLPNT